MPTPLKPEFDNQLSISTMAITRDMLRAVRDSAYLIWTQSRPYTVLNQWNWRKLFLSYLYRHPVYAKLKKEYETEKKEANK